MPHQVNQYFQLEPVSCFLVLTARAIVMRVYILVILSANDLVSSTLRDSGPVSEMTMSKRQSEVVLMMLRCPSDSGESCEAGQEMSWPTPADPSSDGEMCLRRLAAVIL